MAATTEDGSGREWLGRVLGAVLGGGGTYAILTLTGAWGLAPGVVIGIAAAMAVAGFVFGAGIVGAVVELL